MPELSRLRQPPRRALDAVLAVTLEGPGLVAVLASRPTEAELLTITLLLVCAASVFARHRTPVTAALCVSALTVTAVQVGSLNPKLSTLPVNLSTTGILVTSSVLALSLGGAEPLAGSLVGLATLTVASQWQLYNPFPAMIIVGPWLVGRILSSRRNLALALQARGAELEVERERYMLESVRYERARIARELHDIIAHCMSVVVIQAAAGRRTNTTDSNGNDAVLTTIGQLARQAESDIAALTRLLSADQTLDQPLSREVIDQLIAHATLTGTAIDVAVAGDLDAMPAVTSTTLHRVLQEGLTNAFKHAPGAPISVSVNCGAQSTRLEIRNEPPSRTAADLLRRHSGGHGVRGLTERVTAAAGSLKAGPTPAGGWQLTAVVPTRSGSSRQATSTGLESDPCTTRDRRPR